MLNRLFLAAALFALAYSLIPTAQLSAQETETDKKQNQSNTIRQATASINRLQKFTLRYRFDKDEEVRWKVEQIATGRTKVAGKDESYSLRTNSTKRWKITSVDSRGNMTFEYMLEKLSLWNKIGEAEPSSYNSDKDVEAPAEFASDAEKVGRVLAKITIDPMGKIVHRDSDLVDSSSFGAGNVTVPFPDQPIAIDHQWSVPQELTARHDDGRVKQIKWRHLYTLKEVTDQVATIEFKSQILTPIEDPVIRAQIMQKVNSGLITFNLAEGRIVNKEINWDETVQGYAGADSKTEYLARMTESLVNVNAETTGIANTAAEVLIKPNDGKPILRKR